MLRVALRAQGQAGRTAERGLRLKSAREQPADVSDFDVVVDLRNGSSVSIKDTLEANVTVGR
jgi:hypothetical protein